MAPLVRALLTFPLFSLAFAGSVQHQSLSLPSDAQTHRDAVQKIFTDSYSAYKKHAFGHDDLRPISEGFTDSRNGWGASIIDALGTMHIMGLTDLFNEAVEFASKIDFSQSKTRDTVSVFETTIRYIGGLLSAYELNGHHPQALLDKAQQVADKLSAAWTGSSPIPYGFVNFKTGKPVKSGSNIAEAGTLTMEWGMLSKFTGNPAYRKLAERSAKKIMRNPSPLPGLPAQGIDPSTGKGVGGYVTWGGGSDSYLEYLSKYFYLTGGADREFRDAWLLAVDSSIRTLAKESTVGGHLYLADYDAQHRIRHVSSHLACFHGGNWLLGGKLFDNQTIVDYGLRLTDACWNTYAGTATKIGPEAFAFASSSGNYTGNYPPTPSQTQFYNKHGYYITSSYYILRPEVLESNFYAWRVTGDTKYLTRAASAVKSFERYLSVNDAYSGIYDVDDGDSWKVDDMESFWFAEVLKYLWLTFDDPEHISLDDYVFNTEAHPFRVPAARSRPGDVPRQDTVQRPFRTSPGL